MTDKALEEAAEKYSKGYVGARIHFKNGAAYIMERMRCETCMQCMVGNELRLCNEWVADKRTGHLPPKFGCRLWEGKDE